MPTNETPAGVTTNPQETSYNGSPRYPKPLPIGAVKGKTEEGDGSFVVSPGVAELHKDILRRIEKGEL